MIVKNNNNEYNENNKNETDTETTEDDAVEDGKALIKTSLKDSTASEESV